MNRNTNAHFAFNPTNLNISRSKFDRSFTHKTSFNAGKLIPIYCSEVLPGDTCEIKTSMVVRMSTPVYPIMDNLYLDYYFFFVPSRLVWEHWKEFNGENNTSYWTQETEYEIPQLTYPEGSSSNETKSFDTDSVADYFGIPPITENGEIVTVPTAPSNFITISALPFRCYVKIWNDCFRDQNVQTPANLTTGDAQSIGASIAGQADSYILNAELGGDLCPVAKYHDYFTSALPESQKGSPVSIPIGTQAPVLTSSLRLVSSSNSSLSFGVVNGSVDSDQFGVLGLESNLVPGSSNDYELLSGAYLGHEPSQTYVGKIYPNNLYADLSDATAATINQLRMAFQLQKLYEKDARGGTRYIEVINAHFGVTSPDGRQQRSEYLGGKRIPINIAQVLQTSSTDETSPQGNTAAFSHTADVSGNFVKSFTEHGYIIGVACVRQDHTYQQGLERMWSRRRRFDYYWPVFANIGEQPILNKELFVDASYGTASTNEEAFGFQEPWADYRYQPSRVSGEMRSCVVNTLDAWHLADWYSKRPTLSNAWIQEDGSIIDRVLAVSSDVSHQFFADFHFDAKWVRPMPVYSIPGLIDHH